jgi:hypothetical protein
MKHIKNFKQLNEGTNGITSVKYPKFKAVYLEALKDIWNILPTDVPNKADQRTVDELVTYIEDWVISKTHNSAMVGHTDDAFTLIDNLIMSKDNTVKRGEAQLLVNTVKKVQ